MKPTLLTKAFLLLIVSCFCNVTSAESSTAQDELITLEERIDKLIGIPKAKDVKSCIALPLGNKPCGGPRRYVVFSKETTDEAQLRKLLDEYSIADKTVNKEEGLISTCDMAPEPIVTLENGVCKSSL